ncbi:hypothetical protein ACVWZV_003170 [Bradyrhizobium sp. GM5.1]
MRVIPIQPKRVRDESRAFENACVDHVIAGDRRLSRDRHLVIETQAGLEMDIDVVTRAKLRGRGSRVVRRYDSAMKIMKVRRTVIMVVHAAVGAGGERVDQVRRNGIARHRFNDWGQIVVIVVSGGDLVATHDDLGAGCPQSDLHLVLANAERRNGADAGEIRLSCRCFRADWRLNELCCDCRLKQETQGDPGHPCSLAKPDRKPRFPRI